VLHAVGPLLNESGIFVDGEDVAAELVQLTRCGGTEAT
jgi:hypothetical protein